MNTSALSGASVDLVDLTLGYDRHPAVHHVHTRIDGGALVALVGPNGAGKSTLLK
ncbi:MAG: ATP-binding cassette domain-containing protein, partial [Gammaproteobacteria bacterium]|nr:ATP-binding cassette domain-containing protein [Gammaproteobacteria bacterium]